MTKSAMSRCPSRSTCCAYCGSGKRRATGPWSLAKWESQSRAGGLDRLSDALDLMSGRIVHDDDVEWPQLGKERLFDIGEKGFAVHRAVVDP